MAIDDLARAAHQEPSAPMGHGASRAPGPSRLRSVGPVRAATAHGEDEVGGLSTLDGVAALDLMDQPILVADARGDVIHANAAWVEDFGGSGPGDLGRSWTRWFRDDDDVAAAVDAARRAARGRASQRDLFLPAHAGGRWTRWRFWGARPGGRPLALIGVVDVHDERQQRAELAHRAAHDPLTGLVNRRRFLELVERALTAPGADRSRTAVLFVDLDGFKQVNDAHGHRLGDEVLAAAAASLSSSVRPGDVAGRLGGDEFAVLCRGLSRPSDADAIAERFSGSLSRPFVVNGRTVRVAASVGIAHAADGDDVSRIVARADEAMYRSRNRSAGVGARRSADRPGGRGPTGLRPASRA